MSQPKPMPGTAVRPKTVVKGPIRCHKCQMLCRDAEEYLNHSCNPKQRHA
jgi:hypothetical protein